MRTFTSGYPHKVAESQGLFVRGEKIVISEQSKQSFRVSGLTGSYLPNLNMDLKAALTQTCVNAGLPPDSWSTQDVEVFKFRYQFFMEDGIKISESVMSYLRPNPKSVRKE